MPPLRISTERQQEILAEVARLMDTRATREKAINENVSERNRQCHEWFSAEHARISELYECEAKELDLAYVNGLQKARHHYESGLDTVRDDSGKQKRLLIGRAGEARETANLSWRQTRALSIESFQNDLQAAQELGEQTRNTVAGYEEQMDWLRQQAQQMLRRRGLRMEEPPPSSLRVGTTNELVTRYSDAARIAHEHPGGCFLEVHAISRRGLAPADFLCSFCCFDFPLWMVDGVAVLALARCQRWIGVLVGRRYPVCRALPCSSPCPRTVDADAVGGGGCAGFGQSCTGDFGTGE